ncbi:hypothetical protein MCOR02_003778 [Pyricularia oryzae]|nr:hypothetical protein MCOR02_003778 [Pyricularia oryzae]KAI6299103.1 hypothetical protein MCOR29_011045 [Pyricularia oryzae]KAI6363433.1 hypothetical protein MCOR32_008184 [Pyricularia oryzae]KAI6480866.1 hypothetical protein MCOR13_011023 [Pyricularia oryzae]KAI6486719.1 hypothetical protein MCOR11_009190 [Pyricularia oryzae]
MRFSIAAAATLFGAAIAAPAPQASPAPAPNPKETVLLSKFKAFHQLVEGPVNEVSFVISTHKEVGVAAYVCSAVSQQAPLALKPTTFNCAGGVPEKDIYRFQVNEVDTAANTYNMTIYHQTAPAYGLWGEIKLDTTCRPEGVRSEYCEHQDNVEVELHTFGP